MGKNAKRCNGCQRVKKHNEGFTSGWEKKEGKLYCSDNCYKNRPGPKPNNPPPKPNLKQLRQKYLQELTGLKG